MKNLLMSVVLLFAAFLTTGYTYQDVTVLDVQQKCEENIQPDCYCILIYDPVCGCNGVTYGNSCVAMCHGITDYKAGECKEKKPKKVKDPR